MTNAQVTDILENPLYRLMVDCLIVNFLWDALFITALATTKVFENILILFSENGNFAAIKSTDIP